MDRNAEKNVVLIGMPGSGKSTVGRRLAERLGWILVDTDAAIVKKAGRSVSDVFAEQGEARFREVETEVVRKVMSGSGQVVATGGGAVLASENREAMLRNGYVVQLYAPVEAILERLREDRSRPLLAGDMEDRLRRIAEERKDAYSFADFTVNVAERSPEDIVASIVEARRRAFGRGE